MTRRNWDKVRVEHLCMVRGSERLGEDLTSPASEASRPTELRQNGTFLSSPSAGPYRGQTRAGGSQKADATEPHLKACTDLKCPPGRSIVGTELCSRLLPPLRGADSLCTQAGFLKTCTDVELREARTICQSVVQRLNEEMLKRSR
jgi:hypothetical protein